MIPALLALLGGCVTETGNPELDVSLRATAVSSSERVTVSAAPALTVTDAWINLDDVRLVEGDACDTAGEIEHTAEGPFETDLLADTPVAIHIPAVTTDYCRLRVRLDKAEGVTAAPGALDDHSVLLAGERSDGVPFEIRSRSGFELDLRSRGEPFPLDDARDQLLLAFDMAAWIGDLGLATATPDDGIILVDEDHDEATLEAFEAAIEAALGLWSDDGGDGALDDDDDRLD